MNPTGEVKAELGLVVVLVVDLTNFLTNYFPPPIFVNAGGFGTSNRPIISDLGTLIFCLKNGFNGRALFGNLTLSSSTVGKFGIKATVGFDSDQMLSFFN